MSLKQRRPLEVLSKILVLKMYIGTFGIFFLYFWKIETAFTFIFTKKRNKNKVFKFYKLPILDLINQISNPVSIRQIKNVTKTKIKYENVVMSQS